MAALPSDDVEATLDVSNNADGVNEPCGNGTRKCRNRSSKRDNNATICWKFQVPMKHVTYMYKVTMWLNVQVSSWVENKSPGPHSTCNQTKHASSACSQDSLTLRLPKTMRCEAKDS